MKKNITTFFKSVLVSLFLSTVFLGSSVLATGINDKSILNSITGKAGLSGSGNVETVTATVIKAVLSVTALIFLVLMVYAGLLWMTARGDETKIEKSKDTIEAALIGLAVTVSAYAITVFVGSRFEK